MADVQVTDVALVTTGVPADVTVIDVFLNTPLASTASVDVAEVFLVTANAATYPGLLRLNSSGNWVPMDTLRITA